MSDSQGSQGALAASGKMQSEKRPAQQAVALAAALAAPAAAAAIGAIATQQSVDGWYDKLNKPSWGPPKWLFAPVWTLLYGLMGVASWLVWRKGQEKRLFGSNKPAMQQALGLYGLQLGLNSLWSILFFGKRRPDLAFFELLALWGVIAATIRAFGRLRPAAALLMAPYLLWTTFAGLLNGAIWLLNRDEDSAD